MQNQTETKPELLTAAAPTERLAYSIQESADRLGVNYFSVYRLIQRGKLKACRAHCAASSSFRARNC